MTPLGLRLWRVIKPFLIAALLTLIVVGACTGCVAVRTPPTLEEPDGGTAYVPGFSGSTLEAVAPFLPSPWGEVAKIALGALAVPAVGYAGSKRVRRTVHKGHLLTAIGWKDSRPEPDNSKTVKGFAPQD